MENPGRNQLVVKSNALVNAMQDLSLQGTRFLAYVVSCFPRDIKITPGLPYDMTIDVLNFAESFDIDLKNAYREVELLATQLQKKIIQFKQDDGTRVKVCIITKQKYHDGEGRASIRIDEDLLPHILALREKFTKYKIKDVYQFTSAYTWRVYELLAQNKDIKKREFELEEFKWKVGVTEKYSAIGDLKKRVIEPSVYEINKYSDIKVQYDQVKRGRRVTGFIFYITENQDTKTHQKKVRDKVERAFPPQPPKNPDFALRLREEFKVSPKQADQLARLWEGREAQAEKFLARIKHDHESGKVATLGGLTFKVLREEGVRGSLPGV
jgi:plasmid replication initiation protein